MIKTAEAFLDAPHKGGGTLDAGQIAEKVRDWLHENGCDVLISPLLINQYAIACARWKQAEMQLSTHGLIASKNGSIAESPFVGIAERYQKQSNELLDRIKRDMRIALIRKGGTNEKDNQHDPHGPGRQAEALRQ